MHKVKKGLTDFIWSTALLFVTVLLGLAQGSSTANAQLPPPLSVPNLQLLTNGRVEAVVALPGGGVVFGGLFSSVNGVARSNLARLTPEGALDAAWNPGADGQVRALGVDPASGAVFVGGLFSTVGGQARTKVAKISADGLTDALWHPAFDNEPAQFAVDTASGNVFVGGGFFHVDGQLRFGLAKLTIADGALDASWNPGATGVVRALAIDSGSSAVYVGGQFSVVGGQVRNNLAKLSASGSGIVDATWKPEANGLVDVLRFDIVNTRLYAGGQFSFVGGKARNYIARLDSAGAGAADPTWNPAASNEVQDIAIDAPRSAVYTLGAFLNIGGLPRAFIARLSDSGTGAADSIWNASSLLGPLALAVDMVNGSLHVGGTFRSIGGQPRLAFATLDTLSGGALAANDAESVGLAAAIIELPDGASIVGGTFEKVGMSARRNLLRINANGQLDPEWNPSADSSVTSLAIGTDAQSVFVGGNFSTIGGLSRSNVAKLSASGTGVADAAWNPSANLAVMALALDAQEGFLYLGGGFGTVGGQTHARLARVAATGTGGVDSTWSPTADNQVLALVLDGAGAVYAGGSFTHLNTQVRNRLGKLSTAAGAPLDANWNPSADNSVSSLAVSADHVYVGGAFANIGSIPRRALARVNILGNGLVDPDWDPSVVGTVQALAIDEAAASIFVGGVFASLGSTSRMNIAKISSDSGATVDAEWNPGADAGVSVLAITAAGHTLDAGGRFTRIGDRSRLAIAALPLPGFYATTSSIASFDPSTSVTGESVEVAVTVVGEAGVPGGSVIVDDGTQSCTAMLDSGGAGSCAIAFAHAGMHTLLASYSGGGGFSASTAPAVAHFVGRAQTQLSISAHSPDPSTPAQSVAVAVALTVANPGQGTPQGAIDVSDGVDACEIASGENSCELLLSTRGERTLVASYANDDDFEGSTVSVTHHVNRLPAPASDFYGAHEDGVLEVDAAHGVLVNDTDPDGDALTVAVASAGSFTASGVGGTVILSSNGSFSYTPPSNANGIAFFDYIVDDGQESASGTVSIDVSPVNDPPTFSLTASPAWPAGASGARSLPQFATVIDFGPPDESAQQVAAWIVRTVSDPSSVVSSTPTITLDGTLNYTLSGHAGTATFGVILRDDGGTADGGVDTSTEQIFTISVAKDLDRIFVDGFELE